MQLSASHRWTSGDIELFLLTPELVSEDYVTWLNEPEVSRFLESRFTQHSRASTEAFVAQVLASENDIFFGIRSHALNRHVGNIKLGPINRLHGVGEIGIMIGDRGAWGRGIGTTAITILAEIAREELGLRRLSAGCYAQNKGSERAFLRAGFVIEGLRKDYLLLEGTPEDLVLMGKML